MLGFSFCLKWTLGVGDGQGGVACCDSWGCKELDTTEWVNWTELPFPTPGDLPDPGIKPTSLALAGGFFTSEPPGKPQYLAYSVYNFNVHIFHFYKFYLVLLKICCQVFIFAYFLESKSNFQFTISLNTVNIFIFQFSSNSLSPLGL